MKAWRWMWMVSLMLGLCAMPVCGQEVQTEPVAFRSEWEPNENGSSALFRVRVSVPRTSATVPTRNNNARLSAVLYRLHDGSTSAMTARAMASMQTEYAAVGSGTAEDPNRWEWVYVCEVPAELRAPENEGRYEWFFAGWASTYVAISDVMDPARAQDFRYPQEFTNSLAQAEVLLGSTAPWVLSHTRVRSVNAEPVCAVMGNVASPTSSNPTGAYIESPTYNDGVESITFVLGKNTAVNCAVMFDVIKNGAVISSQQLEPTLSGEAQTIAVKTEGPVKFRWRRVNVLAGVSDDVAALTLKNVRVRSLAPLADIKFSGQTATHLGTPTFPGYPDAYAGFRNQVVVSESGESTAPIAGVGFTVKYRQKVEGLATNPIYSQTMVKASGSTEEGDVYTATFEPVVVEQEAENLEQGCFVTRDGQLQSMMPGVYQYWFEGDLQGAYLAGRGREIEKHEVYTVTFGTEADPFTLDLREAPSQHRLVQLAVAGELVWDEATASYTNRTDLLIDMLPCGTNTWRAVVPVAAHHFVYNNVTNDMAFVFAAFDAFTDGRVVSNRVDYGVSELEAIKPTPAFGGVARTTEVLPIVARVGDVSDAVLVEFNTETGVYVATACDYQDFSTWASAGDGTTFSSAEYLEGQDFFLATFDVLRFNDSHTGVLEGWIPDAGPMATTSAFADDFIMDPLRGGGQSTLKFERNLASSQWGCSPEVSALKSFLSDRSACDGVRLLQRRTLVTDGTAGQKTDGFVALNSTSSLEPQSGFALSGVGSMTFNFASRIPFDSDDKLMMFSTEATGLQATVALSNTADISPGGYSVSLVALWSGNSFYEFRVSQIAQVSQDGNALQAACSLAIYSSSDLTTPRASRIINTSLNQKTVQFYIDQNNVLHGKLGTDEVTYNFSGGTSTGGFTGFFSAGCTPTFTNIMIATGKSTTPEWSEVRRSNCFDLAGKWTLNGDTVLTSLKRKSETVKMCVQTRPSGGSLWTTRGGEQAESTMTLNKRVTIDIREGGDVEMRVHVLEGMAVIDNLQITSWRGNDDNKVGDFVTQGFTEGYTGVGLWIEPYNEAESSATTYSGSQVLLMQYSRRDSTRDTSRLQSVVDSALCLISPFSREGFGPVSFSYKINAATGDASYGPASFELQYARLTAAVSSTDLTSDKSSLVWTTVAAFELQSTSGTWAYYSITPRTDAGEELRGTAYPGYLRLVMKPSQYAQVEDPTVAFDNLQMTSYPQSTGNVWKGENVKIASAPIDQLYWKDRKLTAEQHFPDSAILTPMITLNDATSRDTENGAIYERTAVYSPILLNGAGVVSFAARQDVLKPQGVKVFLETSESTEADLDAVADWRTCHTFLVTNEVYSTYSFDLTSLDQQFIGEGQLDISRIRRIRLRANLVDDPYIVPAADRDYTGRVNIDVITVREPVPVSLRVAKVQFAMAAEGATPDFKDDVSQQPLEGAQVYVRVTLDRFLLNPVVDGVYLSCNITNLVADVDYTGLDGVAYNNMGWSADALGAWGRDTWNSVKDPNDPLTVQLTRKSDTVYEGRLPAAVTLMPKNAILRFNAWATYHPADDESKTFTTEQRQEDFKQMPWYYPRDLNAETGEFSPYYWVYSISPGNVWINEINLQDNMSTTFTTLSNQVQFVELCVPVDVDLGGWQVFQVDTGYDTDTSRGFTVPTMRLNARTPQVLDRSGSPSYRDFIVAMSAESKITEMTPAIANRTFAINGDQKFFTSTTTRAFGMKLYRDNGAYEQGISYAFNMGNSSAITNAKRMASEDPDLAKVAAGQAWTNLVYVGSDVYSASYENVYASLGAQDDAQVWTNFIETIADMQTTPGEKNSGQQISKYEGSRFYSVQSEITGLGKHDLYANGSLLYEGGSQTRSWSVPLTSSEIKIAYAPALMHQITSIWAEEHERGTDSDVVTTTRLEHVFFDVKTGSEVTETDLPLPPGREIEFRKPTLEGNLVVRVAYELPETATTFVKQVETYCGEDVPRQPWIGDNFGFSVTLDAANSATYDERARYSVVSAVQCAYVVCATNTMEDWGVDYAWNVIHEGFTLEDCQRVATNGTARVGLIPHTQTSDAVFSTVSAIPLKTLPVDEALQYCGWVVVADPVTGSSFVVRQDVGQFVPQPWMSGTVGSGSPVPYFFVYSTPADSVWINELNITNGTCYLEIVAPQLPATVPAFSIDGWNLEWVQWGAVSGSEMGGLSSLTLLSVTTNTPHVIYLFTGDLPVSFDDRSDAWTMVTLFRPAFTRSDDSSTKVLNFGCVSAGGVVTGLTGQSVPKTAPDLPWHVYPGVSDETNRVGSVSLIGTDLEWGESRTNWVFTTETPGAPNPGQVLPPSPVWSRITIRSEVVNLTSSALLGGWQAYDGSSDPSTTDPLTISQAADLFVGKSFIYTPKAPYYVTSMSMPPDLLTKIDFQRSQIVPQGIIRDLNTGVVTFDDKLFTEDNPVIITFREPPTGQATITVNFTRGNLSATDWVVSQTLFKVDPATGAPATDFEPLDAPGENHGWSYQPVLGDLIGITTKIESASLVNPVSQGPRTNDVYLAWSIILPERIKTSDMTFLNQWGTERWILGNYSSSITIDQLRAQLTAAPTTQRIYAKGGLIKLQDVTIDYAALPGYNTEPPEYRVYRTAPGEGIDCSVANGFVSGAIVRFVLVYDRGTEVQWQSMASFKDDVYPDAPYCPWYVPEDQVNINTILNPDDTVTTRNETPFFWLYGIAPGDVWLNEVTPYSAKQRSFFELALRGETPPMGVSIKGWSIQVLSAPYTRTVEPLDFTLQRTITITQDWGQVSAPATAPGLSFFCAAEKIDSVHVVPDGTTASAFQIYTNSLLQLEDTAYGTYRVYAVRLCRDNGVIEQEVLFFDNLDAAWTATNAVTSELATGIISGGNVRAIASPVTLDQNYQLVQTADGPNWYTLLQDKIETFATPNRMGGASAPIAQVNAALTALPLSLEARVVNGNASGGIVNSGVIINAGTTSTLNTNVSGLQSGAQIATYEVQGAPDSNYSLILKPAHPWMEVKTITQNGQPFTSSEIVEERSHLSARSGPSDATEVLITGKLSTSLEYEVVCDWKEEALSLKSSGAIDVSDVDQMNWLKGFSLDAVLSASACDGMTAQEKYWLTLDADQEQVLDLSVVGFTQVGDQLVPMVELTSAQSINLKAGACFALLGKRTLMETNWVFLQELQAPLTVVEPAEDSSVRVRTIFQEPNVTPLSKEFSYYRVVLMSKKTSQTLPKN